MGLATPEYGSQDDLVRFVGLAAVSANSEPQREDGEVEPNVIAEGCFAIVEDAIAGLSPEVQRAVLLKLKEMIGNHLRQIESTK